MREVDIPLGEWLPDAPAYKNPGLVDAMNVYPSAGGYRPFSSPVAQSATTTETVNGAQMFFDNSSNAVIFGGSSTRLFTDRSGTVTETTGYNATTGWNFERYKELVVAVDAANDPQYLTDIDTDDTWSTLSDAPKAARIGRVDDFLVIGDIVSDLEAGNPTVPHRLRWCAKNDPTASWATDRGTLANYRDLDPKYGKITAIVGGRFGLVFQERAIWRMDFIGSPEGFEFNLVSEDSGAIAPNSVVTIGADTFYLSQDGFRRTNGSDIENIGSSRVNEWFNDTADDANVSLTHGAVNWPQRSIVWGFYPNGGSTFATLLIYNFVLDRWSYSSQAVDYLVQTRVNAETLGTLATPFPSGLGTMSAYTLGYSEWQAKDLGFAAYIESGNGSDFATMDGAALAASFLTGDAMLAPGRRSEVLGVWPGVASESAAITTRIRTRSRHGGAAALSTAASIGADGFCPHKVDGWLHAVRMDIPASAVWDNATNLIVRVRQGGKR